MRNDLSRVLQGLEDNKAFECQDNYKPYMIHYRNQEYRNEIEPGILNIMSVLANICDVDDEYERIMKEYPISKDSVAGKLREFFKKISNGNVRITIEEKDIKEIEYNNVGDFIGDFYITFDLRNLKTSVTMKLHISERHTSFSFESMKPKIEKVDLAELENLKSDNNSFLLSSLINRYIKLFNNNDDKTKNFDYPFEVLYNQDVPRTTNQKRNQCAHLCEFIDKNKTFDHGITKRNIGNIVRSVNLSDPAARKLFLPFLIYADNVFEQISNYEMFEIWLLLLNNTPLVRFQNLKVAWSEGVKASSMKIRSLGFTCYYNGFIDDIRTILSATNEDTLELSIFNIDHPKEFSQVVQDFVINNTTLKALAIPGNRLSSTDILGILKSLENNESLETLDISRNGKFSAEDAKSLIEALEKNTSLTTLKISGIFSKVEGTNFVMGFLQKSKILTALMPGFSSKAAGVECIVDILEIKTLTTLDISCSNIGSEGLKKIAAALEKNTTLTTLRISNCNLDTKAAKWIAQILRSNRKLTTLDISDNNFLFGPAEIECIADALESNPTLTKLNISKTCCRENKTKFAEQIAQILISNATLKSLDISNNGLGPKEVKIIAKALRKNTSLTELDISNNNLKDKGTKHMTRIFVENREPGKSYTLSLSDPPNKTLTKLYMSKNNIGNEGAKYLADAIAKNKSLIHLDISNNDFWGVKANCLADALKKNRFLKVLKIHSSKTLRELSEQTLIALKTNSSLEELSLNCFGRDNEMAECIADALEDNDSLKTLDILLHEGTSIKQRTFLYEVVEKNTTLETLIFTGRSGTQIILSDRVPIENNTDRHTHNQTSEFQRIEIYLEGHFRDF